MMPNPQMVQYSGKRLSSIISSEDACLINSVY